MRRVAAQGPLMTLSGHENSWAFPLRDLLSPSPVGERLAPQFLDRSDLFQSFHVSQDVGLLFCSFQAREPRFRPFNKLLGIGHKTNQVLIVPS